MIQGIETKRKCTPRCWNAKSKKCRCSCAGQNHGSARCNERNQEAPHARMTKEQFFANSERERSPELDFGVWWRDGASYSTFRVSFIVFTGEIYAVNQQESEYEILGTLEVGMMTEEQAKQLAEDKLKGWADVCGQTNSLSWVRSKL